MPVMDGWEFLEKYREINYSKEDCRVYLLSSSLDDADKLRTRDNPEVIDLLVKPISIEMLDEIGKQCRFTRKKLSG